MNGDPTDPVIPAGLASAYSCPRCGCHLVTTVDPYWFACQNTDCQLIEVDIEYLLDRIEGLPLNPVGKKEASG
jgi:hypothetical protein